MKKMLLVLLQPYPYSNTNSRVPKNTVTLFFFVFLFLFLFSPFGVNKAEHKYSYLIICAMHAFNAAIVYFLVSSLMNNQTSILLTEDDWKVYKEILLASLVLLLIGLGSFLIRPLIYNNGHNFSWYYFVRETMNTFLAGIIIYSGFTLVEYHRLLKTNQEKASNLENEIESGRSEIEEPGETIITLIIEKEPFQLNTDEFLFAKADGNYTTFYFNQNNAIVKQLKRASLKNIEEQIKANTPSIIKTHRAFIVNVRHIIKVTGNAQGYQLFFRNIDFTVPVSRAMLPGFKLAVEAN